MTTVINLYGGPGTGKSTSAAFIYSELKQRGVNAELVREYAKDWAWDARQIDAYAQLYVLGKQIRRESQLYGKVDVIVTDSPIACAEYYARRYYHGRIGFAVGETVRAFYAQAEADGHAHAHVWLTRSKPYQAAGRFQTEAQALEVDSDMSELIGGRYSPSTYGTDPESLRSLIAALAVAEQKQETSDT